MLQRQPAAAIEDISEWEEEPGPKAKRAVKVRVHCHEFWGVLTAAEKKKADTAGKKLTAAEKKKKQVDSVREKLQRARTQEREAEDEAVNTEGDEGTPRRKR